MSKLPTAPTDEELAAFCAKARDGDSFLGGMLISSVIESLKARKPLPAPVAAYLAQALEECMRNPKNAAHALGLYKPRKGCPPGMSAGRDFHIAWAVYGLLEQEPACSFEQACAQVADDFHVSYETVERAWEASRSLRKNVAGRALDLLCQPPETRISRKVKVKK